MEIVFIVIALVIIPALIAFINVVADSKKVLMPYDFIDKLLLFTGLYFLYTTVALMTMLVCMKLLGMQYEKSDWNFDTDFTHDTLAIYDAKDYKEE